MEFLGIIDKVLTESGIEHEFQRMKKKSSTYCVSNYQEVGMTIENGMQEFMLYIDIYSTGTRLEIEKVKEKIKQLFLEYTIITENGTGIAITYENAIPVPIDTADYKQIQVNLNVKEWSVN